MKNNLAERLEKVLMQDKLSEPNKLLPALKSDIRDILREYSELNQDITLDVQEAEEGYNLVVFASIRRFKA